jgi:multidrug efflux pump subunit AcrA (membrane-fusion protein)
MYAETTIVLQHKSNVLIIPAGAVERQGGSSYVLVVDRQNKVVKVPVVVGIQGTDRVEISKGLSENQQVIASGQSNYEVGQIVQPKPFTIAMPDQEEDQ